MFTCKKDPFTGPVCNNVIGYQCQFLLSEIVELTSSWVSVPVLILIVGCRFAHICAYCCPTVDVVFTAELDSAVTRSPRTPPPIMFPTWSVA